MVGVAVLEDGGAAVVGQRAFLSGANEAVSEAVVTAQDGAWPVEEGRGGETEEIDAVRKTRRKVAVPGVVM
jgi:hypothetical protein